MSAKEQEAPTIWTAAAVDLPALQQVDMNASLAVSEEDRALTRAVEQDIEREVRAFARRSPVATLRTRPRTR